MFKWFTQFTGKNILMTLLQYNEIYNYNILIIITIHIILNRVENEAV